MRADFQKIADTHPDAADMIHAFQDLLEEPVGRYPEGVIDSFQRSADRYFQFLWDHYEEMQSPDPYDRKYDAWKEDAA